VVRKNAGYFRFDTPEETDGRYKKMYEKAPKTPYQRLMESPIVSDE
jgi:hypothetical protein